MKNSQKYTRTLRLFWISFYSWFENIGSLNSFLCVFLMWFLVRSVHAAEPKNPEINPGPKKFINISGKISDGLNIRLYSEYTTTIKSGCLHTSDSLIAHYLEGAEREAVFRLPLKVNRREAKYSAIAIADAVLPGTCDWQFSGVVAELSTSSGSSDDNNWLILTKRKDFRLSGNENPYVVNFCKSWEKALVCEHADKEHPFIIYDGDPNSVSVDFDLLAPYQPKS